MHARNKRLMGTKSRRAAMFENAERKTQQQLRSPANAIYR